MSQNTQTNFWFPPGLRERGVWLLLMHCIWKLNFLSCRHNAGGRGVLQLIGLKWRGGSYLWLGEGVQLLLGDIASARWWQNKSWNPSSISRLAYDTPLIGVVCSWRQPWSVLVCPIISIQLSILILRLILLLEMAFPLVRWLVGWLVVVPLQ